MLVPSKDKKEKCKEFANYRYAHRGLHDEISPENSLSAFKKAVDSGFGIELDVRLSKDGRLVVFHDDTLDRMTGEVGPVDSKDYDELTNIKLRGSDEKIPGFDEVLELVDGKVPLLVEIKEAKGSLAVTKQTCERLKSYTGEYIIESFNPFALQEVRKNLPEAIVGILSEHFTKNKTFRNSVFYILQTMLLNVLSRPDFVAYNHNHASFLPFKLAKALGYVRFCYTITSEEAEERALKKDFESVIFEGYLPKSPYIKTEK